jgi:2-dehydropantoate 2-reductase
MGRLRYTVFGAGAVGGVIAAHLAQRDAVSVVARGAHLEAIRRNGLRFRDLEGVWREANVAAASDADDLEPADIVLVTLKAQFVATLAGEIDAARKPGGLVVFIQNGLPWWVGPDAGLDAGQRLHDIFLNCAAGVVYFGATIPADGAVAQTAPGKLLLGPALGQ